MKFIKILGVRKTTKIKECYDLKVPNYNNFILYNNILTHNCGKSLLLKYYGITLYNHSHLESNGLSISIPALRGTTDKVYLMGKEININRPGFLGTYKSIHIDEIGENSDLIQHLKIFLSESNYSNNMARADNATRKRTAHVNLSKNLNHEHLGFLRGSIKKLYDNMNPSVAGETKELWDNNWNLFQPLETYDNLYLRAAIKKQRDKLASEQKFWIDGCDIALHDRFPFYFYVEDDSNENLKEILKENASRKKIEEITHMIKCLKNDNIDSYMKSLEKYDVDVDKSYFQKIDDILKEYNIVIDSRVTDVYYMLLKLSMIFNQRIVPNNEDYDLIKYFLETTNRKVTTTDIAIYKINGPKLIDNTQTLRLDDKQFTPINDDDEALGDFR